MLIGQSQDKGVNGVWWYEMGLVVVDKVDFVDSGLCELVHYVHLVYPPYRLICLIVSQCHRASIKEHKEPWIFLVSRYRLISC